AYSSDDVLKINKELKKIEAELGRLPQDKAQGCIKIDIDLLQWNEQVLKPIDLQREDVIQGLQTLL
ncbi:MAG: 2-amino-4-hydroxy-6-hydroxymethyldihydropteridine pyrophosphokinase, partial [Tannerellaceae bacterium]|nr:2-amino-4-hydroxy-6-hydroxymethyldihydropteridine pyrophosphokinase [Tannerellaceae bacterium]